MSHFLKTESRFFLPVIMGEKKAEIRLNDRNFQVGDCIVLSEIDSSKKRTGQKALLEITHILTHAEFPNGLQENYCILSFKLLQTKLNKL